MNRNRTPLENRGIGVSTPVVSAVLFGCGSCSAHNLDIVMIDRNSHIPFAQLPIEAQVLFYMQSMSAWDYHCNGPHTPAEVYGDQERSWNAEGITPRSQWPRRCPGNPEFTFAVRAGRMVPKLPCEFVGAGDFTNAPV
jgi:hypothetical protein